MQGKQLKPAGKHSKVMKMVFQVIEAFPLIRVIHMGA
jgi:hypothetical protein